MTQNQPRSPAGRPTGGEFASVPRAETTGSLAPEVTPLRRAAAVAEVDGLAQTHRAHAVGADWRSVPEPLTLAGGSDLADSVVRRVMQNRHLPRDVVVAAVSDELAGYKAHQLRGGGTRVRLYGPGADFPGQVTDAVLDALNRSPQEVEVPPLDPALVVAEWDDRAPEWDPAAGTTRAEAMKATLDAYVAQIGAVAMSENQDGLLAEHAIEAVNLPGVAEDAARSLRQWPGGDRPLDVYDLAYQIVESAAEVETP